jgi:hypothetical protein
MGKAGIGSLKSGSRFFISPNLNFIYSSQKLHDVPMFQNMGTREKYNIELYSYFNLF